MDLELNRVDYCIVGTTLRNAMKLLPSNGYKQQQQVRNNSNSKPKIPKIKSSHKQVVVGDQDGVLQVFSIKKEDTQIQFKTLPTDKITTIQMGGATGPGIFNIYTNLIVLHSFRF